MANLKIQLAFLAPTLWTASFLFAPAPAQAQDEAAPTPQESAAPATQESAAPAPTATEAAAPAVEAAKPAECPKCDCPACPPCPPPPPPAPPADAVEWKAQSKGGMLITGGNSQSKNFTFGVNASRKEGKNKLALEGGLAYGTSNNSVATVDSTNTIVEVQRKEVVSTNNMAAKGRYDRFLSENNTVFASGLAAADKIAGKTFFGGGQLGYSRQLLKDAMHTLVVELGYDFSYERYVSQGPTTPDPVSIHSARVFAGETLSLTKETGVTASIEALFNLNKESKAIDANDGTTGVKAFKDTRVNGKVALTTNLWKSLSFGFSFGFKYDQNPAQRPIPAGAPAGAHWPAQYWSLAYVQRWDTLTEATLIYTFF
jgi:hypothetical protein